MRKISQVRFKSYARYYQYAVIALLKTVLISKDNSPSSPERGVLARGELTSGYDHSRVPLSGSRASVRLQRGQVGRITFLQHCRQGVIFSRYLTHDEYLTWLQVYRRVHAYVLIATVGVVDNHSVFLKKINQNFQSNKNYPKPR